MSAFISKKKPEEQNMKKVNGDHDESGGGGEEEEVQEWREQIEEAIRRVDEGRIDSLRVGQANMEQVGQRRRENIFSSSIFLSSGDGTEDGAGRV